MLNPQAAGTYAAIAYIHVLMGNNDEAVEWFHNALGLKRDDTFSTTMLNYIMGQLTDEKPPYASKSFFVFIYHVQLLIVSAY